MLGTTRLNSYPEWRNFRCLFLEYPILDSSIWASSWDYGTYHIGDQQWLRWACTSTQSRQSLCCSHTWNMEADKGLDQKSDIHPTGWLHMQVWRMSLRRTKSTIISWDGSFIPFSLHQSDIQTFPPYMQDIHILRAAYAVKKGYFPALSLT